MSTYVDCPKCGSEFVVSDDIVSSTLRCPDCLQWVNSMDDFVGVGSYSSYGDAGDSLFDDYGFERGYDY